MGKRTLKKINEKDELIVASDAQANSVEQMSLDQLFKELAKETKGSDEATQDPENEFEKLQKEVSTLPKIECELELKSDPKAIRPQTKSFVVNVNDPIMVVRKKSKEEPTDAGSKWFGMKKPEMTDALKRDLLVLKNRSVLDPKRHYKKEKWQVPKFFETGTVVEGNTEFYSARMNKKDRGRTLADEILQDSAANTYFKRKYGEIQKKNSSGSQLRYKKIKSKRQGH